MINRAPRTWAALYHWLDRKKNFEGDFKLLFALKTRLAELIARTKPAVIISVYPAYAHLLNEIMGDSGRQTTANASSSSRTPSRSIASGIVARPTIFWSRTNKPRASCARPESRTQKIKTLGFPVSPKFAALNCLPETRTGFESASPLHDQCWEAHRSGDCAAALLLYRKCESHRHRWTR